MKSQLATWPVHLRPLMSSYFTDGVPYPHLPSMPPTEASHPSAVPYAPQSKTHRQPSPVGRQSARLNTVVPDPGGASKRVEGLHKPTSPYSTEQHMRQAQPTAAGGAIIQTRQAEMQAESKAERCRLPVGPTGGSGIPRPMTGIASKANMVDPASLKGHTGGPASRESPGGRSSPAASPSTTPRSIQIVDSAFCGPSEDWGRSNPAALSATQAALGSAEVKEHTLPSSSTEDQGGIWHRTGQSRFDSGGDSSIADQSGMQHHPHAQDQARPAGKLLDGGEVDRSWPGDFDGGAGVGGKACIQHAEMPAPEISLSRFSPFAAATTGFDSTFDEASK